MVLLNIFCTEDMWFDLSVLGEFVKFTISGRYVKRRNLQYVYQMVNFGGIRQLTNCDLNLQVINGKAYKSFKKEVVHCNKDHIQANGSSEQAV